MMNLYLSTIFLLVLIMTGCSDMTVDLASVETPYLVFGQGGGFTGMKSEYYLFDDGHVFLMNEGDTLQYLNKCSRRKAQDLIAEYHEHADSDVYSPGNHYYYISHFNPDSLSTVTWSDRSEGIPENLNLYWQKLIDLTQSH